MALFEKTKLDTDLFTKNVSRSIYINKFMYNDIKINTFLKIIDFFYGNLISMGIKACSWENSTFYGEKHNSSIWTGCQNYAIFSMEQNEQAQHTHSFLTFISYFYLTNIRL